MTWFAIRDEETRHFEPADGRLPTDRFLASGSLVIETRLSSDGRPQTLLQFRDVHPWERSLSVKALPCGGIVLIQSQGGETRHMALSIDTSERADLLRITYSWDAPSRRCSLSIERPERGTVRYIDATHPWPLWLDDIKAMALSPYGIEIDNGVEYFAFSDKIEPVGPMPSLSASVPLLANGAFRPAGNIRKGDLVETLENGLVPVLNHVKRHVPARGSFRPVRLRSPYFGLQRDIVVAPDQKLVVSQPMVEYMFGCEAVLLPARHLVNGTSAIWEDRSTTMTYHQLVLPAHETLIAAGSPVESLFIGRLRRKSDLHQRSLLCGCPRQALPEHMLSAHQVLRPFEAITLVEQCAA